MSRKLWHFLNSSLFLVLLGSILTVIVGTYINNRYQSETWKREKQFKMLSHRIDRGTEFIEKLSDVMNRRFFGLQRVLWAAKSYDKSKTSQIWDEYYQSVIDWNLQLNANHGMIELFIDKKLASVFLNFADVKNVDDPSGIHGRFVLAHQLTLEVLNCKLTDCADLNEKIENANYVLSVLDGQIDRFILDMNRVFLRQAKEMEEL